MIGARIIIVEDEEIVVLQLKTLLQRKGYQIVGTFASGEEALEGIPSLHPDLVLLDIRLRGELDGIETAFRMSQHNEVPILYLTAHSDADTIQRAKGTNVYSYILKPFNAQELDIAIQMALHKHTIDEKKSSLLHELQVAHDTLQSKVRENAAELSDANAALRVLIRQRAEDKKDQEEKVLTNIRSLVSPCVEQLKKSPLSSTAESYLSLLESSLQQITSEFSVRLSSKFIGLTQKELEVAALIRDGRSSKDIQTMLGVSKATIDSHRNHIRAKLGIKNKKTNLRSFLLSLQ